MGLISQLPEKRVDNKDISPTTAAPTMHHGKQGNAAAARMDARKHSREGEAARDDCWMVTAVCTSVC